MRSCKRDAVPIRASNVYTAQPAFSAVYATCSTALLPTSLEPLATLRPSSPTTRTSISSKGRPLVVTSASCSSTAGDGLGIHVDGCQVSSSVRLNHVSSMRKQCTLLPVLPFPLASPPQRATHQACAATRRQAGCSCLSCRSTRSCRRTGRTRSQRARWRAPRLRRQRKEGDGGRRGP